MEPWGTPALTKSEDEDAPFITTFCLRPER